LAAGVSLIALLAAGGGHWAVLQTFAWARMIVAYSAENTLAEAVSMTFDGNHPCPLCLKVEEARKQQRPQPITAEVRKLELFCEARACQAYPTAWRRHPGTPFFSDLHLDFIEAPPRPPPRLG
jgi:hypothetical protein